jgi:hypothetical protein
MKFDAPEVKEPKREMSAMIHESGALLIKCGDKVVAFDSEGACVHEDYKIEFWEDVARKKYYPGDSITITF